jgi:dolichyl-diphosphooligosaccharide--protein glycosyltransferase
MALPLFIIVVVTVGVSTGLLSGFSGRLLQMFDPTYASKKIPIIASVAEHQPTAWAKYFSDCALYIILFPVGCYIIISKYHTARKFNETELLLLIYGISTLYFASIMVRLVLVFTPAMVFISGLGLHHLLKAISRRRHNALSITMAITLLLISMYSVLHAVWFARYSFSGTHLHFPVIAAQGQESSDDYREAYRWLWCNTGRDQRVMSWWDYGYQISSLGGRGCHADGNTNNFTHIGIIGMTMSSPEAQSWQVARTMEADYMLVIFGGASQYSGDDINKFLWMPRIANQTFTNISGNMYQATPYDHIVGPRITKNMSTSMLFKFCYYNFIKFKIHQSYNPGFDFSRRFQIPEIENIRLSLFEEAFSSKHWIVRIYRVKPDPIWNRIY